MIETNRESGLEDVKVNEAEQAQPAEQELTDEQLLQLAEGSCTWGANCR